MKHDRRKALHGLAGAAGLATTAGVTLPAREAHANTIVNLGDQVFTKLVGDEKPVRGGIIRLASSQYIGNMNPNRWPVNDWVATSYIHEKLMVNDGAFRPSVPYVAESVVRESPRAIVITLRPNVQFHDGSPLTADSIKFMYDWIKKPENAAWTAGTVADLESVEVIGPLKVRMHLKNTWSSFEGMLAGAAGYVMGDKALAADPKRFESTLPVGLGPYMVDEASPGNFLKLKRNPNWWMGKAIGRPEAPYFDGLQLSVIPDPAVRLANFRAGKLDILALDKPQYASLHNDRNFTVSVLPANHSTAYRFNSAKGPCSDLRVRKAISHAIDRKGLIDGTQFGLARQANAILPSDHWAHNADIAPIDFNPTMSKELLAQAGHGQGLTIRGFVLNTPESIQVAEAVKNMLSKIGVTWQFDALAPVALAARRTAVDFDMADGGWRFVLDPDLTMTGLYHPIGNFSQGRAPNPELHKEIDAARNELAFEKRRVMYRAIEKKIADDYQDAYLWWDLNAVAYQKWVRGYSAENQLRYKESWWFTHPFWFADGKPGTLG